MPSNPFQVQAQTGSKHGRMQTPLLLGFGLLIAFAIILASFHHHNDLKAHPDCAICAVTNHAPVETAPPPLLTGPAPASDALLAPLALTVLFSRPISAFTSRAPPH